MDVAVVVVWSVGRSDRGSDICLRNSWLLRMTLCPEFIRGRFLRQSASPFLLYRSSNLFVRRLQRCTYNVCSQQSLACVCRNPLSVMVYVRIQCHLRTTLWKLMFSHASTVGHWVPGLDALIHACDRTISSYRREFFDMPKRVPPFVSLAFKRMKKNIMGPFFSCWTAITYSSRWSWTRDLRQPLNVLSKNCYVG